MRIIDLNQELKKPNPAAGARPAMVPYMYQVVEDDPDDPEGEKKMVAMKPMTVGYFLFLIVESAQKTLKLMKIVSLCERISEGGQLEVDDADWKELKKAIEVSDRGDGLIRGLVLRAVEDAKEIKKEKDGEKKAAAA